MISQTVKTNTYRIKEVLSVQCSSPLKAEPCAANLGSNACQLASALRIIGALWHDYHRHKRLTAGQSFVSLYRLDCPPLLRLCFPPVCKFNESVKRIFVGMVRLVIVVMTTKPSTTKCPPTLTHSNNPTNILQTKKI